MKSAELQKRRESKAQAGKELEEGLVQHHQLEQHHQKHLQEEERTHSQLVNVEQQLQKSGVQTHPEATTQIISEATAAAQEDLQLKQQAQVHRYACPAT